MKVFRKLTKKSNSLTLVTLIALLALGITNGCGCNEETNETTSMLSISPNRSSLQGRSGSDRKVELTFKLAAGETISAKLDKLKLVIKATSTSGGGKILYEVSGAKEQVLGGEGREVQLDSLLSSAELGENEDKKASFTFEPDATTKSMTMFCYAVDADGNKKSDDLTIEWKDQVAGPSVKIVDASTKINLIGDTNKAFKLKFKNDTTTNLDATALGKIKVIIGGTKVPTSVKFNNGTSDVNIASATTTLADLLVGDLAVGAESSEVGLIIDTGTEAAVDFTIELQGSTSNGVEIKKAIAWNKEDLSVKIVDAGMKVNLVGDTNKAFKLKFKNDTTANLDATALGKIKFMIGGTIAPTSVQYTKNGSQYTISGKTTLADLLVVNLAAGAESAEVDMIIDTGTETAVDFTIELQGSTSNGVDTKKAIAWNKEDLNVKIVDADVKVNLVGDANKGFKIKFKNDTTTNLDATALEKIQVIIGSTTVPTSVQYTKSGGQHTIVNGTSTLADLLAGDLAAGAESAEVELKIDTGTEAAVDFIIELQGSTGNGGDTKKAIGWKKEDLSVKIVDAGSKINLVGDPNKAFKVKFKNDTTANLDVTALKKIKIAIGGTTVPTSVRYNNGTSGVNIVSSTTTLADLLVVDLAGGAESAEVELIIDTGAEAVVDFTIELQGSTSKVGDIKKAIRWQKENLNVKIVDAKSKIKLQGNTKDCKLKFKNDTTANIDATTLGKIQVVIGGTAVPTFVKYTKNSSQYDIVSGTTTLADLLVGDLNTNTESAEVDLTIDTGTEAVVDFTIELQGSTSKEGDIKKAIAWKKEDLEVRILGAGEIELQGDTKEFKLRFKNETDTKLDATALGKIKVIVGGTTVPTAVKYNGSNKDVNIISGTTTLADLLNADLHGRAIAEVELTVDPGTATAVDFTISLQGSTAKFTSKTIKWSQEDLRVKILDTVNKIKLQGGSKSFKLRFKNETDAKLDATALGKMKVVIGGGVKSAAVKYNNGTNDVKIITGTTTLADLLKNADLNGKGIAEIDLTIDTEAEVAIDFTIALQGSTSKIVSRPVEWKN